MSGLSFETRRTQANLAVRQIADSLYTRFRSSVGDDAELPEGGVAWHPSDRPSSLAIVPMSPTTTCQAGFADGAEASVMASSSPVRAGHQNGMSSSLGLLAGGFAAVGAGRSTSWTPFAGYQPES